MDELLFRSADEAARLVRERKISSRELTELTLARIEDVNPALNAVVELRPEAALRAAAAADEALARGEAAGPLHGVPMTIKDSFNVAGLHTTWGNPAFSGFVADADATVAGRLRRAGAIICGKTNVAFMLTDFGQTANELYGVTRNPWDTARTPGGSSGGPAAAVSAGMTFLEYGSDLVGSVRIPAAFCGVYGLKPTARIVPLTGFQPPGPPAGPSEMMYMSAVGPLGRFAADLRTALKVTAGPEGQEARACSWALPPPRYGRLADFRVGVVLDDGRFGVSSEVAGPISEAVSALGQAGAKVTVGWPEGIDPVRQFESFGFHVELFFAYAGAGAATGSLPEAVAQEGQRMAARAAWNRYFEDVDVFLCPVNFTPAFAHDDRPFGERVIATPEGDRRYDHQPFWVAQSSLPGLPAVAAPVGRTSTGLPVGIQIVGPLYEDDTAITFAELLADVTGGYERPPC